MALICVKHQIQFETDPSDTRRPPVLRCATCVAEAKAKVAVEKVRREISQYGEVTNGKRRTVDA